MLFNVLLYQSGNTSNKLGHLEMGKGFLKDPLFSQASQQQTLSQEGFVCKKFIKEKDQ